MVLQRGRDVPVWGSAAPGEKVTVRFRSQEKTTVADDEGRWSITLDPLKLGPADDLSISGRQEVVFRNVAVGDVWLGSGQSNMANAVGLYAAKDAALAKAAKGTYPNLRLFTVHDGVMGEWHPAAPETTWGFSALLFYFGYRLKAELGVPIGVISTAQGGTASGQWLHIQAFQTSSAIQRELAESAGTEEKTLPKMLIGRHFTANIQPLIPFALKGILWDQGESGTGFSRVSQSTMTASLIADWRKRWGRERLPFLFMEKPSGGGQAWSEAKSIWGELAERSLPSKPPSLKNGRFREEFVKLLELPQTGIVTTRDLPGGEHPPQKSLYGRRAFLAALRLAYDRDEIPASPVYRGHTIRNGEIVVKFDETGGGLVTPPGERLLGFAIAGTDRKFRWADARIQGDTVIVSSESVHKPLAVRYAWSDNPGWANLFNREGMPALSFRTDDWTDK